MRSLSNLSSFSLANSHSSSLSSLYSLSDDMETLSNSYQESLLSRRKNKNLIKNDSILCKYPLNIIYNIYIIFYILLCFIYLIV